VAFDATDAMIREWASEAIRSGTLPGIARDRAVDLRDFVIDRFPASATAPGHRIFVRPKTPFGGSV
jgi:hypothetical protein